MNMSKHLGPLAVAAVLWSALAGWLLWLRNSEQTYTQQYLQRLAAHAVIPVYRPGDTVTWKDAGKVLLSGWSENEGSFRWSSDKTAAFLFRMPPGAASASYRLKMDFSRTVTSVQHVTVFLNDTFLGNSAIRSKGSVNLEVPHHLLKPGVNIIKLQLPDAVQPNLFDVRLLGVALGDFDLEPAAAAGPQL